MNPINQIAKQLKLSAGGVTAVVSLLDEGNTVPFIARYRKEKTNSLDEEQIRAIQEQIARWRSLIDRRQTILNTIKEQGKLTPALEAQILAADHATILEDLYLPYRPKRRTRASMARAKGLDPLAELILQQEQTNRSLSELTRPFLNDEVPTLAAALEGAKDIVAEQVSENSAVRQALRQKALKWAVFQSQKIEKTNDERGVYELYYAYENRVDRIQPYQILAINRGESEKVLRVKVDIPERDWIMAVRSQFRPHRRSPFADTFQEAITDGAHRLLLPAIERDIRRALTDQAEAHAIQVFAQNLRGLLLQPPLADQIVLAIDPAYRTGCKVAILDATGKVLETAAIYPHKPQLKRTEALKTLNQLVQKHGVTLIAIGNGTASRETEQLAAELIRSQPGVHYMMVNEAGASVYSASPLAKAELPGLDVTLRGAVSIGRRVQDPLAELVKIDPKSIGIGLYQHDVNQKQLMESLNHVVESVVNQVGVDANTASPALLTHISGIGPKLAKQIVAYRNKNGRFTNRTQLKKVAGLGSKAFEQSAGFLRIRDGDNPLDASAIHPESYAVANAVLKRTQINPKADAETKAVKIQAYKENVPLAQLAAALGTGVPTLSDILDQIVQPGRDPREALPAPILRSDVLQMEDLSEGMRLHGTVRNVVDFGAFIDIGVKQDGLLHKSQKPRHIQLNVGDVVELVVLSVDMARNRISLGWT